MKANDPQRLPEAAGYQATALTWLLFPIVGISPRKDKILHSATEFKFDVEFALTELKNNLKRAIVSIIGVRHPQFLVPVTEDQEIKTCSEQRLFKKHKLYEEYRKALYQIQNERKFDTKDVNVVVHGFEGETNSLFHDTCRFDRSLCSKDMKHLSTNSNKLLAIAYWNSFLEPVGRKSTKSDITSFKTKLRCPSKIIIAFVNDDSVAVFVSLRRTIINWDHFASLAGFWEDSALDDINEEYDLFVEHLHNCTKKAESFKTTTVSVETEAVMEALDNQGVPTLYIKLNLQNTMFMCNGSRMPTLNGTNISECTSYVYLGRELTMMNDLTPRARQEEKSGLGSVQEHRGCSEEDQEHPDPCSPLQHHFTYCFDLCFGNLAISQAGRKRGSKIRHAAVSAIESKIRWAGHVMRFDDNRWTRAVSDWIPHYIKRSRWSDFFTKSFKENYDALRVPRKERTTGRLWHAIGTNDVEELTGTRSISLKINGSQGDKEDGNLSPYNSAGYIAQTASAAKSIGGKLECAREVMKPSTYVPADANHVRPGDIKIIAGMGDSYMAAFACMFPLSEEIMLPTRGEPRRK
ncbi:hypothetical protein RB195_014238 [Necator americanus]|uniref:Uncharacterized protein n=1 Tax=Necator americanus TaxID=51031 RepID=A0ABR1DZ97_NECAM